MVDSRETGGAAAGCASALAAAASARGTLAQRRAGWGAGDDRLARQTSADRPVFASDRVPVCVVVIFVWSRGTAIERPAVFPYGAL